MVIIVVTTFLRTARKIPTFHTDRRSVRSVAPLLDENNNNKIETEPDTAKFGLLFVDSHVNLSFVRVKFAKKKTTDHWTRIKSPEKTSNDVSEV